MGFLSYLLYPWGFILQGLAIVHFIRRRPETYWIFIILFLGAPGAIIYIFLANLKFITNLLYCRHKKLSNILRKRMSRYYR